jgi:hypothetical protein
MSDLPDSLSPRSGDVVSHPHPFHFDLSSVSSWLHPVSRMERRLEQDRIGHQTGKQAPFLWSGFAGVPGFCVCPCPRRHLRRPSKPLLPRRSAVGKKASPPSVNASSKRRGGGLGSCACPCSRRQLGPPSEFPAKPTLRSAIGAGQRLQSRLEDRPVRRLSRGLAGVPGSCVLSHRHQRLCPCLRVCAYLCPCGVP